MIRTISVGIALLTLAACSGTGQIAPQATMAVPEGMAQIVVYRPPTMVNALIDLRLYAGSTKVATLGNNEMTVLAAAPGQHVLKSDFWNMSGYAETIVDVQAGRTYLVEAQSGSFRQNFADDSPAFVQRMWGREGQGGARMASGMEATAGREELRGYKYVPPLVIAPLQGMTVRRGW